MRRLLLLFGLILALSVAAQSDAASILNSFRVGDWRGFAYSDAPRQFDHCSASKVLEGISVTYSVDRQLHWNLRFSNPNWTFIKGATTSLNLRIDDLGAVVGPATAIDKTTLEFTPRDDFGFFADLRTAHELRVVIGGLLLKFSLDGGTEVLSALTQCATRFTRYPLNAKSKIFDPDPAQSAARTKEAGELAKLIISYSRAPKTEIVNLQDIKQDIKNDFPLDAMWKVDVLVNTGLTILDSASPLPEVFSAVVARASRACHGGFFFITQSEQKSGKQIGRIYSSCQTPDGMTETYYLIFPRAKRGYYLITEATTGSSFINTGFRLARAYEANLRSIVMVAVQTLKSDAD